MKKKTLTQPRLYVRMPEEMPGQLLTMLGNDLILTGEVWDEIEDHLPEHHREENIVSHCGCGNPVYEAVLGHVAIGFSRVGDELRIRSIRMKFDD